MAAIIKVFPTRYLFVLLGITAPILFNSCRFCPQVTDQLCELRSAPLAKSPVVPTQSMVFQVPGTLVVFHGSACVRSTKSGTKDILRIEQSLDLPAYATQATVFLNGWEVDYLNGDHHVFGLGTLIDTIRIEKNTLKWQAGGALSDENFDDAYQWCYHFTVIAWNPARINLLVDHTDGDCNKPNSTVGNFYSSLNTNTTTALSSFASFIQNPIFANQKTVSILPRGFGFEWGDCGTDDHHLLQIAYSIGHPEVFIEAGKGYKKGFSTTVPVSSSMASQVSNGFVSWESATIFKDNDDRRDYKFGEAVSGLSGSDLGIVEPPFSILLFNGEDLNIIPGSPDVRTQTFTVTNIPYNQAIPVLTGWDLNYITSDQHVQKVGVWIDKFHYDIAPGASTGTLTYTLASALHDEDRSPDFDIKHKVTILGFQPTAGKVVVTHK